MTLPGMPGVPVEMTNTVLRNEVLWMRRQSLGEDKRYVFLQTIGVLASRQVICRKCLH